MQSMDKIMDVLEQRVLDNNRQQAQASGGSPLAVPRPPQKNKFDPICWPIVIT